jgi:hypothetical protein
MLDPERLAYAGAAAVQLEWPYRQSFVDVSKLPLPRRGPFFRASSQKKRVLLLLLFIPISARHDDYMPPQADC